MVKTPYLVITGVFLFVALLIFLTKLPEIRETNTEGPETSDAKLSGTLAFRHLIKGVVAQFFYVGAQVGVASFIIRFAEFTLPGTHEKAAAHYLQAHLAGFMIGRFTGSAIMQKVRAPRLLSLFAGASLLCLLVVLFTFPYHMGQETSTGVRPGSESRDAHDLATLFQFPVKDSLECRLLTPQSRSITDMNVRRMRS